MKNNNEKVVGILGGMGPYASLEFARLLLDITPAKKDWDHLHVVIDNNPKIPSRTRAVLYGEKSPVTAMISSINRLATAGADFAVVPCNSAHYFYDEVVSHITIPWLNMLEVIASKVKMKKPLILGAYLVTKRKIYKPYFPHAKYLSGCDSAEMIRLIEELKREAKLSNVMLKRLMQIIYHASKRADSLILACTELSLITDRLIEIELPIFDSTKLYAHAAYDYARSLRRD